MKKSSFQLHDHYSLLLGLGSPWKVADVDLDMAAKLVEIEVVYPEEYMVLCPECDKSCARKDHREERRWRHLDTMQFQTIIRSRVPRSECPEHGVKTIDVPWAGAGSRFTLLFERFAIEVIMASKSLKEAAALLGLSWDQVHHIQSRAVERGLNRRKLSSMNKVGIDEKSFLKGHQYASLMTDIEGERVVDVVQGRTLEAADELWSKIPEKVRGKVEAVAMDMWDAYKTSTHKNAPNAEIVHDKFHIAKYLSGAVDQVRRGENKQLIKKGDDTLKGTKYLFLKRVGNMRLEEKQQFRELRQTTLKSARAWAIKETFEDFWSYSYEGSALKFFARWYWWATHSRLAPVIKVAKMLKRHLENIVTYLKYRITNALIEGFNSKIQSIKANARGFRNFENYRVAILFACRKLELYP